MKERKPFGKRLIGLVDRYFEPIIKGDLVIQQNTVIEVVIALAEFGILVANRSNMPGKLTVKIYSEAMSKIPGTIVETKFSEEANEVKNQGNLN